MLSLYPVWNLAQLGFGYAVLPISDLPFPFLLSFLCFSLEGKVIDQFRIKSGHQNCDKVYSLLLKSNVILQKHLIPEEIGRGRISAPRLNQNTKSLNVIPNRGPIKYKNQLSCRFGGVNYKYRNTRYLYIHQLNRQRYINYLKLNISITIKNKGRRVKICDNKYF